MLSNNKYLKWIIIYLNQIVMNYTLCKNSQAPSCLSNSANFFWKTRFISKKSKNVFWFFEFRWEIKVLYFHLSPLGETSRDSRAALSPLIFYGSTCKKTFWYIYWRFRSKLCTDTTDSHSFSLSLHPKWSDSMKISQHRNI